MYLILRHNTWVAYHEISPQYRGMLGRARFVRTTGESDHARAKIKAAEFEVEWRNKIEEIKGKGAVSIKNISSICMFSDNFGKDLSAHLHRAMGGMDCYIDEWVELLEKGDHTKKTIHMKKTTVAKFCSHFKSVESVKKVSVQEWINEFILNDVATATIRRLLSEIRDHVRPTLESSTLCAISYNGPVDIIDPNLPSLGPLVVRLCRASAAISHHGRRLLSSFRATGPAFPPPGWRGVCFPFFTFFGFAARGWSKVKSRREDKATKVRAKRVLDVGFPPWGNMACC